jgi:CheY-specific phosphatase CheX
MPKPKIDRAELYQMLRAGKPQNEIAQVFGVSESAISKAKKELKINVVKSVALENAHKIVDKNLNTIDQLQKINNEANNLLDELEAGPELKLKIMSEIRGQLRLQLEIFQTLYDWKAIQEFQEVVVSTIGEVSPQSKNEIVRKLKEKNALRSSVTIT